MRGQGDNRFPAAWRRALLPVVGAVLAGNAAYFLLLFPWLPERWQQRPFALDPGLGLDFLVCLGLYLLLRWFDSRRRGQ